MPIKDFKNLFWVVDTETGEKHKLGHIEDIELTASDSQELAEASRLSNEQEKMI